MEKRTILLTGASSIVGQKITSSLLSMGHDVIGVARWRKSAPCNHDNFSFYSCDLSDRNQTKLLIKNLQANHPNIDSLILNAGLSLFGDFEEIDLNQMDALFEVNLFSAIFLTKAFLPHFKPLDRSDIIVIGSTSSIQAKQEGTLFCASKFALRGFAKALKAECSASCVKVSILHPEEAQDKILDPEDIAHFVALVFQLKGETLLDEIFLSPRKTKFRFTETPFSFEKSGTSKPSLLNPAK